MTSQQEKAKLFQSLHSWPVAVAQGYGDGHKIPMEDVIANVSRIVKGTDLPVTLDFEGAYSVDEAGIKTNIKTALDVGIVGFNFEDQVVGGEGLHDVMLQAKRVGAVRSAIDESSVDAYLNARTDLFLKTNPKDHDETMLAEAIERAKAYEIAGASGFFAPALLDETLIGKLCEAINLPVNIIAIPGCPPKARLAELGVARISYGPVPYRQMMKVLSEGAKEAFA